MYFLICTPIQRLSKKESIYTDAHQLTCPLWSVFGTSTLIGVPVVTPASIHQSSTKFRMLKKKHLQTQELLENFRIEPSATPDEIRHVSVSFLGVVIRLWPGLLNLTILDVYFIINFLHQKKQTEMLSAAYLSNP